MLPLRRGRVLDTSGNDVKLTLIELDVSVAQLDREMPSRRGVCLVPESATKLLTHPDVVFLPVSDADPAVTSLAFRPDFNTPALEAFRETARTVARAAQLPEQRLSPDQFPSRVDADDVPNSRTTE